MDVEQIEISKTENLEDFYEDYSVKFNKLKFTYFKNFLSKNETYLDFLKMGSRQFAFQLPENIGEVFVKKESTPLFWLLESPILVSCEKLFSENGSGYKNYNRSEIKKNFTKWAIAAEPVQRKIFASITIKIIKTGEFSNTFIDLIYHALILIFDESYQNPYKAIDELEKAKSRIEETVGDALLKKELNYLVQLYRGFAFLAINNTEEASKEFSFAIDTKNSGITAKLYFAYLSAIQKRNDFTKALIKEMLDFDLERLKYAVDKSSIVLFNFFLQNPVFPNILNFYEFAEYTDYIKTELIASRIDTRKITANLFNRLNQLKKCELDEYYCEETRQAIKFLYEISDQHSNNQMMFLSFASVHINEKFHFVLDDITSKIKDKFYANYTRIMGLYQKSIEESEKFTEQYSKEVDDIKSSMQKKLSSSVQQIEEYVKDALWEVEERKKNLSYQRSFDPAVSFRNSMSYNVIVSIIVFIIGGIAGYFNNSGYFESDFYIMLGKIILTGVKWSSLTFVIGFFISTFVSGLVLFDRSNEKQRLEKRTFELQKQREISVDMLRKEADQKQKAMSEGYIERIESHRRKIEDIKREKERQEPLLIAQAEEQLAPFIEKLSPLYLR